jgi:hypothetical protein
LLRQGYRSINRLWKIGREGELLVCFQARETLRQRLLNHPDMVVSSRPSDSPARFRSQRSSHLSFIRTRVTSNLAKKESNGEFSMQVGRIFVTRSDSGQSQPNYSEFLGSSTAAVISTYSYHPKEDRDLSTAASVWGSELGFDTLNNPIKEVWPDIRRKVHR